MKSLNNVNVFERMWNTKNYTIHHGLLKNFENYQNEPNEKYEKFSYKFNIVELSDLYKKFDLGSLQSDDEITTIINATNWVHNLMKKKDAQMKDFSNTKTIDIIQEISMHNVSGNCKVHATILRDVLLALGIINRTITCKPLDYYFIDCHVVNIVYSECYKKWILFDPSLNIYYKNEDDIILSLEELRRDLLNEKKIKIEYIDLNERLSYYDSLIHNHEFVKNIRDCKIISYMCKNIFRFSSLIDCFDYENSRTIIEYNLIPANYFSVPYETTTVIKDKKIKFVEKYISSPGFFWTLPDVEIQTKI